MIFSLYLVVTRINFSLDNIDNVVIGDIVTPTTTYTPGVSRLKLILTSKLNPSFG